MPSTEQAIDFRQELGEVELGRAGSTGGVEVGSVPVSLFLRELGIGLAGPPAGAMMLVVGQESGQIAQARVGPRGASAPAVAGRAHDRTGIQEGGTQLVDFGLIHGFKAPGGIGVLVDLVGVRHGHTAGGDPFFYSPPD